MKKILSVLAVVALSAALFFFVYMRPRHVVPVLMYHAIDTDRSSTLFVSPENFRAQMAYLDSHGYSVISLDDLVKGSGEGKRFSSKTVVITFDDGFEDNYINAFPVLSHYGMPATIFLITGHIGISDGYLDWEQVQLMTTGGIDIGAHTRSHAYLPSIKDDKKLWVEIVGSKEDIEVRTGRKVKYFCYPTGGFNEEVKKIVKKAGYYGACTTNRGYDRSNKDVYEINRIKVTNSDMTKPLHFRAKLSGYYNLFRSLKEGG